MSDERQDIVEGDLDAAERGPEDESDVSEVPVPDTDPGQAQAEPPDDDPLEMGEEGLGSPAAPEATVESVLEAILFASDEPVPVSRLAMLVEVTTKQVGAAVDGLNQKYQAHGHAFRIEKIAGGLQMLTLPQYNGYLRKLLRAREDSKLSPAALETLAIVAYKQPAIRADVEAIRGVACGEVLRSLMVKGLVKIVGRAEIVGRPMQYGTTRRFLEVFGLNSLKDLPSVEDLKRPDAVVRPEPPRPEPVQPEETRPEAAGESPPAGG